MSPFKAFLFLGLFRGAPTCAVSLPTESLSANFLQPCANGGFTLTVYCPLSIVLSAGYMLDISVFAALLPLSDLWSLAIKVPTHSLKFFIDYDPSFRQDATYLF